MILEGTVWVDWKKQKHLKNKNVGIKTKVLRSRRQRGGHYRVVLSNFDFERNTEIGIQLKIGNMFVTREGKSAQRKGTLKEGIVNQEKQHVR